MAKLTNEQLNTIKNAKPLGVVRIDNYFTDEVKIEKFDEIDAFNFEGHNIKNFYRVDASIFKYVFEEIRDNPNCSFVTPYNETIKEGLMPETISVLIKETRKCIEEKIGCQLMNYYGIYTPVNVPLAGEDIFGDELNIAAKNSEGLSKRASRYHDKDETTYVMSIDYAVAGEEYIEFEDVKLPGSTFSKSVYFFNAEESLEYMKEKLQSLIEHPKLVKLNDGEKAKLLSKLQEDFIMSLLVRRVVFQDADFGNHNLGAIVKDGDAKLMNFDFEYCFHSKEGPYKAGGIMRYFQRFFPEIWNKFYTKSEQLLKNIEDADIVTLRKTFGDTNLVEAIRINLKYLITNRSNVSTGNM